jgi:tetratricopeptide (TPR) repeat protein
MGISSFPALTLALVLAAEVAAAQVPRRAAPDPAALLERCTGIPDADACRAVLLLPISARQRSIALTYLAESDMVAGDSLLLAALELDSTNALPHATLGIRGSRWGQPGIAHLRRAVELRPDWRHLHAMIAAGYRAGDTAQVDTLVQLWRAAVAAEPTVAGHHVGLASALARRDRLADAEASYRRALELDSQDRSAVFGVCETRLRQRKIAPAQEPCTRAIRGWTPAHGTDLRQILWHAEEAADYVLALAAAEQ